jgi:streptogrisin C
MALLWKVLIGMFLTLPVGAYYAGTVVGPYDTATPPSAPSATSPEAPGSTSPEGPELEPGPSQAPPDGASLASWSDARAENTPAEPERSVKDEEPSPDARLRQGEPTDQPSEPTAESPSGSPSESPSESPAENPSESPDDGSTGSPDGTGDPADGASGVPSEEPAGDPSAGTSSQSTTDGSTELGGF